MRKESLYSLKRKWQINPWYRWSHAQGRKIRPARYDRSMGPSPSAGKHSSLSSATASSSSSFQSLVVSHSFSNSISMGSSSRPSGASVNGKNEASVDERWEEILWEMGWTHRRSLSLLCRSRSSSIRLNTSLRDRVVVLALFGCCCSSVGTVRSLSNVTTSSTFCGSMIRLLRQFSSIYQGSRCQYMRNAWGTQAGWNTCFVLIRFGRPCLPAGTTQSTIFATSRAR